MKKKIWYKVEKLFGWERVKLSLQSWNTQKTAQVVLEPNRSCPSQDAGVFENSSVLENTRWYFLWLKECSHVILFCSNNFRTHNYSAQHNTIYYTQYIEHKTFSTSHATHMQNDSKMTSYIFNMRHTHNTQHALYST